MYICSDIWPLSAISKLSQFILHAFLRCLMVRCPQVWLLAHQALLRHAVRKIVCSLFTMVSWQPVKGNFTAVLVNALSRLRQQLCIVVRNNCYRLYCGLMQRLVCITYLPTLLNILSGLWTWTRSTILWILLHHGLRKASSICRQLQREWAYKNCAVQEGRARSHTLCIVTHHRHGYGIAS